VFGLAFVIRPVEEEKGHCPAAALMGVTGCLIGTEVVEEKCFGFLGAWTECLDDDGDDGEGLFLMPLRGRSG
jgi:hypothetical protein